MEKIRIFFFRSAGHWSAISFYFHKFTSLVLLNRIYWPQCFSGYIFFLFFCSWIDIYIGNMNNNEFMDAENVFNASMDIGYFYFYIFFPQYPRSNWIDGFLLLWLIHYIYIYIFFLADDHHHLLPFFVVVVVVWSDTLFIDGHQWMDTLQHVWTNECTESVVQVDTWLLFFRWFCSSFLFVWLEFFFIFYFILNSNLINEILEHFIFFILSLFWIIS